MCPRNRGKVSVVLEVIFEERVNTDTLEFLPVSVRYRGESGVRSSRGVEAALGERLCRENVSDAESFPSAGQSDPCPGTANARPSATSTCSSGHKLSIMGA